MLAITTWSKWKVTTSGTPICRAYAVMVISAIPPGAVAMIMVAMGRPKAQARALRMAGSCSRSLTKSLIDVSMPSIAARVV